MNASIQSLAAAFDNLGANPLRTLLSTLGVVIGVASLEAVIISCVGSVLGVVIGLTGAVVISLVIQRVTEAPIFMALTWQSVAVAAGAALVVGLAFGTYPARRAARLSPIEAIRHE